MSRVKLFCSAVARLSWLYVDQGYGRCRSRSHSSISVLKDDQNVEMLSGDRDAFGDGSLTIISTPGHTLGHQSLLVKLPKTGALILTGDLVHFQYMWDHRIVPPFNFNREHSLASIERVARLLAEHKAQLWIGHDKDITAKIGRAPKFYE